jgi:predicted dehydrogenase
MHPWWRARRETAATDDPAVCIAVIGCGAVAERYYLPALVRHPTVAGKAILVDCDPARTRRLADHYGIKTCLSDFRDALAVADGVIVALPTHLHYPVAAEFLTRGVPVLCEKPLAPSANHGRVLVELAEQSGAALLVNHQRRLYPNLCKVKELLATAALGDPKFIRYDVGEMFDWPSVSGFYFKGDLSARGVLRDRGIHVLDVICWWLGGKPRVLAVHLDSLGGSEAVAHVRFEHSGCMGEIRLSWLSSFPCRFAVTCQQGIVEGEVYDFRTLAITQASGRRHSVRLNPRGLGYIDMADQMVSGLIRSITHSGRPPVSGRDVLDALALLDECYEVATPFEMPWYDLPEVRNGQR